MRKLLNDYPRCGIHFIMGNHDCRQIFGNRLASLAATKSHFQVHAHALRLGSALFIHGDCVHRRMDATDFVRYRESWQRYPQRWAIAAHAYTCVDRLGLTRVTHQACFPRRKTAERIAYYLDSAYPDWRTTTRDCYFGHTHQPFTNYEYDGVTFHNTGSAIRGMGFNPICFSIDSPGKTSDYAG